MIDAPPPRDLGLLRSTAVRCLATPLLPVLLLLAVGFVFFGSAGRDDAHITYWAAHTLSEFGEILNYNGDRIEQSSSLFQVVLLGVLRRLTGVPLVLLGHLSSIAFGVATVYAAYRLADNVKPGSGVPVAWLVATSAPIVYWTFGGLETTMMAFWSIPLVGVMASYLRADRPTPGHLLAVFGVMLAFASTRPEGPAVILCLALGLVGPGSLLRWTGGTVHRGWLRRTMYVSGAAVLGTLLLLGWRYLYFGDLLPQPVSAKAAGLSVDRARSGFWYFVDTLWPGGWNRPMILLVALGLGMALLEARRGEKGIELLLASLFVVAYGSFIVLSGGDWMEVGRFLAPMVPSAILLAVYGLRRIAGPGRICRISVAALIGLQLGGTLTVGAQESMGIPLWQRDAYRQAFVPTETTGRFSWFEVHNRTNLRYTATIPYLREVLDTLVSHTETPIHVLTGQMGMIPYHVLERHYGAVIYTDRLGLTDRTMTGCSLLDGRERTRVGLDNGYADIFATWDGLLSECGVPRPDVIVGLQAGDVGPAAEKGYRIVYTQSGAITLPGSFTGRNVTTLMMVGIRDSLAEILPRYLRSVRVDLPLHPPGRGATLGTGTYESWK